MTLVVREAEGTDVEVACALWNRAEAARTGSHATDAESDELLRATKEAIAKPGARLLIGELNGRPVAVIYGVPLRSDSTKGQVGMLAVEPTRWGKGLGTQLLEELVDALRRDGCTHLRMNVDPANDRARALYERQGWRHLGETEQTTDGSELIYRIEPQ